MAVAQKKKLFDGRYEIISIVGRGSRSVVYHARNTLDGNTEVALKVLIENKKDKTSLTEKLRREALALVSSHHPSVIRLDDFHSVGDICYLAMEYAPESDLRKFSQKFDGKLSVNIVHDFMLQVADGLDYIHRTGIIHRDIKPDNILVVSDTQFRIGDFGVAFLPGDPIDAKDLQYAVGTMDYMAPEVLEGIEYTQRSDIYSLGVTAYELLSGKNPFADRSMVAQLDSRKSLPSLTEENSSIPAYLSDIIAKACSYDAKDRFQSAREIVQALKSKKVPSSAATKVAATSRPQPKLTVVAGTQVIDSPRKSSQEFVLTDESEPLAAASPSPSSYEKPRSSEAAPLSDEPTAEHAQIGDQNMEGAIALKDSRHSRTPTVFISKESVERVRAENLVDDKSANTARRFAQKTAHAEPTSSFNLSAELARLTAGVSNRTIITTALGIFLAMFVSMKLLRSGVASTTQQATAVQTSAALPEESAAPIQAGAELPFPMLPSGVYSGSISEVIGSAPLALTILSFSEQGKLAVLIGADGFNPSVITVPEDAEAIKVVANGYIIELSATSTNGMIEGTAKNLVTGSNGSFKLRPSST
jgi:serine/threonine protein kinase